MAGRFPLFTDTCVNGHLVDALIQHGWDLVRGIDLYPERTPDSVLFARAAQEGRVFVSNDGPIERLARSWLAEGRPFRIVFWPPLPALDDWGTAARIRRACHGGRSLRVSGPAAQAQPLRPA